MPDPPPPKERPYPGTALAPPRLAHPSSATAYAELQITTNFTFLTGASHPDEYVERAAALGHRAVAVTDANTLAGIVRAHVAAREADIRLVVGCRLVLRRQIDDASGAPVSVLVYPVSRRGYAGLCRLLTLGKRRSAKGQCQLCVHDLLEHRDDLLAAVVPPDRLDQPFIEFLRGLRDAFDDDRLSLVMSSLYGPDDRRRLAQIALLAEHAGVPEMATNDVHYHAVRRRALQDVLVCIRSGCTVQTAGHRLFPHAERCLKPPDEMARLFADHPRALARTIEIAERAQAFSLDELKYQYPDEICPAGRSPMRHLAELTWSGAAERYADRVPPAVRRQIEHELGLIDELSYAPYFLTVHDLVQFATGRGILCQGRGAAANSAVCYCLGITAVDPDRIDVLFERFVSRERNEPPDIDIDFEHERREEVIQYLYRKYGRDRAALTAEVITYRGRSAVREVGKALGLSLDLVDRLARSLDWWDHGRVDPQRLAGLGLSPDDPTVTHLAGLTGEILGFPRHLSQHVGGFVITRDPLCEMVPIENAAMEDRTVIEWDKDDIDAMGMLKVDVLGLGMLTCIRKAFELVELHQGRRLTLATVPAEDPLVYDMISQADTIGVFQIESRAQMSMLPRLRPRCYYDLVIEVAIVRPGPIQGKMVHPYLRRRNGEEPVTFPNDRIREVLGKTLGVPLFQEQAMKLAIVAAGFTPDEADRLRRAIAAWKRKGDAIFAFGQKLVEGMVVGGYDRAFAERCYRQIQGFSEYGFPESHAASFALIVYVSAWLKRHYPAAFAAALLNSQPMGFYAPAQIVRDAAQHGVEVRRIDVHESDWDCTLEDGGDVLRLGMRLVKGLRREDARGLSYAALYHGRFDTIEQLWRHSGAGVAVLRALASADAFASMGLDRQQALWHIRNLHDAPMPLFEQAAVAAPDAAAAPACLPVISEPRKVMYDYRSTGLSLKAHPVSFIRERLARLGATPAGELADEQKWPGGRAIAVAGIILIRQRPGTASGIVFMTLEDETGVANLIVRPPVFERYRTAARHAVCVLARGRVERQGQVVHVMTTKFESLDDQMQNLLHRSRDFR
ncbi:MAG: error-prone DNA polymerase [Phycisphaeraceae bacterium]|nr:error-prone DNA polymerase [Phycisphaeraceae bacterium]